MAGRDLFTEESKAKGIDLFASENTDNGRDLFKDETTSGKDLFAEEDRSFIGKTTDVAKDIVRDVTRPVIESIARPVQLAELGLGSLGVEPYKTATKGGVESQDVLAKGSALERFYGEIPKERSPKEAVGTAAMTVAPFVNSPAWSGALFFGGSAMEEDDSAAAIVGKTILGGVIGKAANSLFGQVGKTVKSVKAGKGVMASLPTKEAASKMLTDAINLPKSLMASFDLSAPFRQGIFFIGRPKQFVPAVMKSIKYAFSKKSFDEGMEQIAKRPTADLMVKGKLALTEMGENLAKREEAFMSNYAEDLPIFGKIIEGSDRAYTGFLNKLRADTFDDLVRGAKTSGREMTDELAESIGTFVNSATGRGNLGSLENQAVNLSNFFFSPRLMKARIDMLNPNFYAKLDPFVRKEAMKSLLSLTGTGMTILGIAKKGGADVEADPRSSDFGKIKVGNTRYSIFGGFEPYIKSAAQLITGQKKSTVTGIVSDKKRTDTISQFFKYKESPAIGFAHTLLSGRGFDGKKVDVKQEAIDRATPLMLQDLSDAMKEYGLGKGIAMAAPAAVGFGVQTYSQNVKQVVNTAKTVKSEHTKLRKQGRANEARNLLDRTKDVRSTGTRLAPFQKRINKIEGIIEDTKGNTRLGNSTRNTRLKRYNNLLDEMNEKADNRLKEIRKAQKNEASRQNRILRLGDI